MGLDDEIDNISTETAEKDSLVDKIRGVAPKAAGLGATAASFFALHRLMDANQLNIALASMSSLFAGWLTYIASERVAYNFLFKPKTKEYLKEKKSFKDKIKEIKNPFSFALDNPLVTTLLLIGKPIYDSLISPLYKLARSPFTKACLNPERRMELMEYIGHFKPGEYESLMLRCGDILEKQVVEFILVPSAFCFVAGFGIYVTINMINQVINPKYAKDTKGRLMASNLEKKRDYEGALKILEEIAGRNPVREVFFNIGNIYLNNNKVDTALKHYSEGIKLPKSMAPLDRFLSNPLISKSISISEYKSLRKSIKKNKNIASYLKLAALHSMLPNRLKAFEVMEEAEGVFPESHEIKGLHSLMLQETDKKKSRKKLRETLDIIKNNPSLMENMRVVDESAHKVYELDSPFFSEMFKFKEGDENELQKEIMFTLFMANNLRKYPQFRTVEPLDLFSDDDGGLYVMKHEEGTPLSRMGQPKLEYFAAAAEALGLIHAVMPRDICPIECIADIKTKIYKSPVLSDEEKEDLSDACVSILHGFESMQRVFIKDHHANNILIVTGKEQENIRLILLDFDYKGTAFPGFDTAKLTEQGRNFENTEEGDSERLYLIDKYVKSFNMYEKDDYCKINSSEEFFMNHLRSAIIKALSFYFFSSSNPSKDEERIGFVENSIHCIDILKSHFPDEYRRIDHYYEKTRGIMNNLPKTNEELADRGIISPNSSQIMGL